MITQIQGGSSDQYVIIYHMDLPGAISLTWINFNPSMDK